MRPSNSQFEFESQTQSNPPIEFAVYIFVHTYKAYKGQIYI